MKVYCVMERYVYAEEDTLTVTHVCATQEIAEAFRDKLKAEADKECNFTGLSFYVKEYNVEGT